MSSYKLAGIDIHKKVLMWSWWRWRRIRRSGRRSAGASEALLELREMADWVQEQEAQKAVMESTAQ